jgi:hypothetical protein
MVQVKGYICFPFHLTLYVDGFESRLLILLIRLPSPCLGKATICHHRRSPYLATQNFNTVIISILFQPVNLLTHTSPYVSTQFFSYQPISLRSYESPYFATLLYNLSPIFLLAPNLSPFCILQANKPRKY